MQGPDHETGGQRRTSGLERGSAYPRQPISSPSELPGKVMNATRKIAFNSGTAMQLSAAHKGNEGNGADNERGRREEDEVPPPADSPDQELAEELVSGAPSEPDGREDDRDRRRDVQPMRRAVNTSGPGTASRKMASGIHKAHDKP